MTEGISLCTRFESAADVLNCAVRGSPEVEVSEAAHLQAERAVQTTRKPLNPELDLESVRSDAGDWNHELSLKQTIELGGKREARMAVARAAVARVGAEREKARARVALETVTSLYRLRQIQVEMTVIDEIIETLEAVQRPYGRQTDEYESRSVR